MGNFGRLSRWTSTVRVSASCLRPDNLAHIPISIQRLHIIYELLGMAEHSHTTDENSDAKIWIPLGEYIGFTTTAHCPDRLVQRTTQLYSHT
jgi:hypothetical protein